MVISIHRKWESLANHAGKFAEKLSQTEFLSQKDWNGSKSVYKRLSNEIKALGQGMKSIKQNPMNVKVLQAVETHMQIIEMRLRHLSPQNKADTLHKLYEAQFKNLQQRLSCRK